MKIRKMLSLFCLSCLIPMAAFAVSYDDEEKKSEKDAKEEKYAKQKYSLKLSVMGSASSGGGCWGPKPAGGGPAKVFVRSWEKKKSIEDLRVTLVEVARVDKSTYILKSIQHVNFGSIKPKTSGSMPVPKFNKGSFYAAFACNFTKKGGEKMVVRLYSRIKDFPIGTTFNKAGRKSKPLDLSKRR